MSEATSTHFVAHLGEATPGVEARLLKWAEGCVEHFFERDVGTASLYFARAEGRTVRQMQSLLRTLTSRWNLPLGKLEPGWLRALSPEEFRSRCDARGRSSAAPLAPAGSSSEAAEPPLEGRGNAGKLAQPYATDSGVLLPAGHGEVRLPEGFDQRSQALLAAMSA